MTIIFFKTKQKYLIIPAVFQTLPLSLSTTNVSLSGLSTVTQLPTSQTAAAAASVRIQPVSVISVVAADSLMTTTSAGAGQSGRRTQGRLRTSSDGLQLIEDVDPLEQTDDD